MEIKLEIGQVEVDLVDVWYKENYWMATQGALGQTKTGPFKYNQGHRKAILWDGAGTIVTEVLDLDYPPNHSINAGAVTGRAFHYAKNRLMSYGEHRWCHRKPEED
jgi:hypothetical protein